MKGRADAKFNVIRFTKREIEHDIKIYGSIFRKLFRQIIAGQEARVMQRLPIAIGKPTLRNIMDGAYEDKTLGLAMRPVYVTIIEDSANKILDQIEEGFIKSVRPELMLDQEVFKFANRYSLAMAEYVDQVTARKIKRMILSGLKERLHYSEIAKNIKNKIFKDLSMGYRSRMIARTEAHGMIENGRQLGAKKSKIIKTKTWSAAMADARDTHKEANGQTVLLNEAYIVGGYKLMYPGDTSLGAGMEEIIFCRCSSLFSSKPRKRRLKPEIPFKPKPKKVKSPKQIRREIEKIHQASLKELNKLEYQANRYQEKFRELRRVAKLDSAEKYKDLYMKTRAKEDFIKTRDALRMSKLCRVTDKGYDLNPVFSLRVTKLEEAWLRKGLNEFSQLVDEKVVAKASLWVDKVAQRSYYARGTTYIGTPAISYNDKKVVVHELGHWLEEVNPKVHEATMAFYKKRTMGERLSQLTNGYGVEELTRKDKFIFPYMGKDYEGRASEIVSMGLGEFYRDPYMLAHKDPEYFDFLYKLVRGIF